MREYFFDCASTSRVEDRVLEKMMPYFQEKYQNPSSLYSSRLLSDIQDVRNGVRRYTKKNWDSVIFTSGGCEGNTFIFRGIYDWCLENNWIPVFIISEIEHESIMSARKHLTGAIWRTVPVNVSGDVSAEDLACVIEDVKTNTDGYCVVLVSIQGVNNELGTDQNINELAKVAHHYKCLFHSDMTQGMKMDFSEDSFNDVDAITFSGHKIGTPKGVGVVCFSDSIVPSPLIYGTQMFGYRGGTENVPYIIGLGEAIRILEEKNDKRRWRFAKSYFVQVLQKLNINFRVNGHVIFGSNILNITLLGEDAVDTQSLVLLLANKGIYCSTGSACHEGFHATRKPSYVLKAIGLSDEEAYSTIRFSWGDDTTYEDIEYVSCELKKCIDYLKKERNENVGI